MYDEDVRAVEDILTSIPELAQWHPYDRRKLAERVVLALD